MVLKRWWREKYPMSLKETPPNVAVNTPVSKFSVIYLRPFMKIMI
jgi:hypothetical protein